MTHSSSSLTPAARLEEEFSGMTQVAFMKDIAESSQLDHVIEKLALIGQKVLHKERLRCSLNATPESMTSALKHTEQFLGSLPGNTSERAAALTTEDFFRDDIGFVTQDKVQMHFELPFQVNFMSRSFKTVPFTHQDFPRFAQFALSMRV